MRKLKETTVSQIFLQSIALMAVITFLTFIVIFLTAQFRLNKEQRESVYALSEIVSQAIETADDSTESLERLVDLRLYSIARGMGDDLRGEPLSEISRERLSALKDKWGVTHITLFVPQGDDIVGVRSTDPNEVGLSTKTWGQWHTAIRQLLELEPVTVPKGFASPHFWAGPVSRSDVDQGHYKYAYFYDGGTEFIINPFIAAEDMYQFVYDSGPSQLIRRIVSSTPYIESIAVINPKAYLFKSAKGIVEPRTDLPVLYGNDVYPLSQDADYYSKSLHGAVHEHVAFKIGPTSLQKVYVSLPNQRVLTIVINMEEEKRLGRFLLMLLGGLFAVVILGIYWIGRRAGRKSTLLLKAEKERLQVAEDFKQTISMLPEAIYKCRKETSGGSVITYLEGTAVEPLRGSDKTEYGQSPGDVFPETFAASMEAALQAAYRGEPGEFTAEMGGRIYFNVVKPVHRPDSETIAEAVGYAVDITERKQSEDKIRRLAYYDTLTQLPNRAHFFERLDEWIRGAAETDMLAVMYIDLDNFKHVNETLSHDTGDILLTEMAARFRRCLRPGDFLSRMGGDEFTILLPNAGARAEMEPVIARFLQAARKPVYLAGREIMITLTAGISVYPRDGKTAQTLFKHADLALYHAKYKEKDNYSFYSPEMNQSAVQHLELHEDLRRALRENEFVLHYQPQVDLATRRLCGVEALVRWNHPKKGLLSPAHFIAFAEEHGYIGKIGDWVIRTACQQFVQWKREGLPPFKISINLSAYQFRHKRLADKVEQVLRETGMEPAYLNFEITESTYMRDIGVTMDVLRQLKSLRASISIDDFGTGYSSLSYLSRFPIDCLKIDRSFVTNVNEDKSAAAVVKSIIDLSNNLGLTVIAEGVETWEQLHFLEKAGSHQIQGYLASPPVPAEQIVRFVGGLLEDAAAASEGSGTL